MFPYPVAVQVGTPHLGRLANTLLMLLNVVQDGDQPANSGPSTSLTTVSDEDVHPFRGRLRKRKIKHAKPVAVAVAA